MIVSESKYLWNHKFNENQRTIFSIIASVFKHNNWESISHYSDLTELSLKNINKYNPNATRRSMAGWISHLNKKGLTISVPTYTITPGKTVYDGGIAITEQGLDFIKNNFDLIEKYISKKGIELYDYLKE